MRRAVTLLVALAAVAAAVAMSRGALPFLPFFQDRAAVGTSVSPGGPLPLAVEPDPDDPPQLELTVPPVALAPPGGAIIQGGLVRIPRPKVDPSEPRRVGLQVGHWQIQDVPQEYGTRILTQTGASWAGYDEVDINLDVAERTARLLRAQGVVVDILPATVPLGYLADVFVALHADSDGVGELSGFKMARGVRRGPYEDRLLSDIRTAYGAETGLEYDAERVTRNMTQYYAATWWRYQHATSPFTPSVILEMAFVSNRSDLSLLVDHPDRVATGIANGILTFLDETPRSKIFGEDLLLPLAPIRQGRAASPSP